MARRALIIDGGKVREGRERLGLNQPEFARLCGITQSGLSRIELQGRNPRPGLTRIIAEQLGVSIDAITSTAELEPVNR